jgi:hypothetical protein
LSASVDRYVEQVPMRYKRLNLVRPVVRVSLVAAVGALCACHVFLLTGVVRNVRLEFKFRWIFNAH